MIELQEIFLREINRLNDASKKGPLDMDDIKKLDLLTRSWKSYSGNQIVDDKDPLDGLTAQEILELARSSIEVD